MSKTTKPSNRLLAALPAKEYARLLPKLKEIPLNYHETIYEAGGVIRRVYFPSSGIVSLLAAAEERSFLEVGIVGKEGFVGIPAFLGVKTSNNLALVQGKGVALEMKTADFLAECENGSVLSRLLQRYTHSLLTQSSQSAACNQFHPIEARLARCLLMMHDRIESDEFQTTQEVLSNMLGVRREGINKSATKLQQNGLIRYSRGKIAILNRAGLEAAAGRCYSVIKEEYN